MTDTIRDDPKAKLEAAWDALRASIPTTLLMSERLEIWKAALQYGDARVGDFVQHMKGVRL